MAYFEFLHIINKAAMNILTCSFFEIHSFLLGLSLEVDSLGHRICILPGHRSELDMYTGQLATRCADHWQCNGIYIYTKDK